jgi:hypothetical protein
MALARPRHQLRPISEATEQPDPQAGSTNVVAGMSLVALDLLEPVVGYGQILAAVTGSRQAFTERQPAPRHASFRLQVMVTAAA